MPARFFFVTLWLNVLCSVDVTEKSMDTWRNDVVMIKSAIRAFDQAKKIT
jgi:hypothetical protein